jgi:DNA-binding GntR family transcriptional regulator
VRQRQGRTLTEDVYRDLRQRILHGELASGARLHLGDLAQSGEVSLGVVREAVTRLASEGLLHATPQSGFRVPTLSAEHLADLTWARCHVESLTVGESVTHGDTDWEASLVAAHHVLSVTPPVSSDGINPAWMNAHRQFHAALAAGCPNVTLLDVRQRLFDEGELYRHWSARAPGPRRDIAAEHADLLTAALNRDADHAAYLLREHVRYTAQLALGATEGRSRDQESAGADEGAHHSGG